MYTVARIDDYETNIYEICTVLCCCVVFVIDQQKSIFIVLNIN